MKISAAIITWNDQANIDPCLESLHWVDEIVAVDGGSNDRTIEKLKDHGVQFEVLPIKDFTSQRNAAIKKATGDWVLFLEANERVPSPLAREIQRLLSRDHERCAFALKRETAFFEKKLNFGGTQHDVRVRLWPRGKVSFEESCQEKVLTDLPVRNLRQSLLSYGIQNMRHYRRVVEKMMPFEVSSLCKNRQDVGLKDYMFRPLATFFLCYFWKMGFRDGWAGLQYAYLSAHFEFLKYYQFKKKLDAEVIGFSRSLC